MKKDGIALQYAPEAHRSDSIIVEAAAMQNVNARQYASRNSSLLASLKNDGMGLRNVSVELQSDFSVVEACVKQDGFALQYASDALKNNSAIVLMAVNSAPYSLSLASDALKKQQIL